MVNRRNLEWDDFIAGEKYRVFKKPEHLGSIVYPYIGETGECIWTDKNHGVQMRFTLKSGVVERIIPKECLEEMEPTVILTPNNVIIGNHYRIKSPPKHWAECPKLYALLGRIGKLIKLTPTDTPIAVLEMTEEEQRCIPLNNLEPVITIITPTPVMDLTDDVLTNAILTNPKGCLKIIKGLAKMNKDPRLKVFLERGYI